MANEKSVSCSTFTLAEFQDANRSLAEMFSEVLQMPQVTKCIRINKQKIHNSETIKKLEGELSEVKTAYSASCENVERLEMDYDKLKKEADEKVMYNKTKIREKEELEKQYALLSKSKLSHHDQQLLESTKLRYKALRNMTQVKFYFDKSDSDRLEGYAFNTVNNKIKYFSISDCSTLEKDQISEKIMACMEDVDGTIFSDIQLE